MMNILKKSITLLIVLFLSGCAHHSGYYSARSNSAAVGVSVDAYLPYRSYSNYYDHDVYLRRPDKHVYRNSKPYFRKRDRYDHRYYDKQARNDHKHESRYNYKRRNDKRDRNYAYSKKGKGKRNHVNRWNAPATRYDNHRHR